MSKRARIAQLEPNGEARPITESEQRAIRARARGDARRTTLDRGFSIDELFQEFMHRGRRQGGRGSAKAAEPAPDTCVR